MKVVLGKPNTLYKLIKRLNSGQVVLSYNADIIVGNYVKLNENFYDSFWNLED